MTPALRLSIGLGWLLVGAVMAAKPAAPLNNQAGWLGSASHTPQQPQSGQPVRITARVQESVVELTLQYQVVEPGSYLELKDPAYKTNWSSLAMQRGGREVGGAIWNADLPGPLQKHRRLVRYRFSGVDSVGKHLSAPDPAAPMPNYAYFVYDGIPAWSAAIHPRSTDPKLRENLVFEAQTMSDVQAYHLLGKKTSVENATWNEQVGGKEYKYTGTLVVDGVVYDHVRYRARGGVWRYAMGKNMWKFDLPAGHRLAARDDLGRPHPVPWSKVNLRACIQQGNYGHRGEQGLFEAVGFRLFNLAGVAAPHTHWIQLRIIDEPEETPADQYHGDFWGLYLAIENEDGSFLKAHHLPDGNLYKMAGGGGELSHHGTGGATNRSDLDRFLGTYNGSNPSDAWWRTNLNLPAYYGYRAICECIHHYDISDGKNYDYYLNPQTGRLQVVPWDIDLTWADGMYGGGDEPFRSRVLARPVFQLEFQNRLRELRDLLYNPEQTGHLIDQCAAVIGKPGGAPSMAEADRRKWDYHPAMAMGGQAGQGLFYQAVPTKDLAGMVQLMKNYVKSRGAWIDAALLNDPQIPATPTASYAGPADYPVKDLRFRAAAYRGAHEFAAMKWRLAETTPPTTVPARWPHLYEINPVWESAETTTATPELVLPANAASPGHTYRLRVRMKDTTGRWSHWSPPLEFVAGR